MIFIKPSIKEIYEKFLNNNFIINYLKENNLLLTHSNIYGNSAVAGMSSNDITTFILVKNKEIIYDLAGVLDRYKNSFESKRINDLLSERVAYTEIAYAFKKDPSNFPTEAYKNIIYTYKYCSVSSFFQNNRDRFMPEYDFFELSKNEVAASFYESLMKEFDKLDCVLGKCCEYLDFDKIPWDLITYLTQLLGFEKSTIDATMQEENKFRELAKNILDIYRIKGTDYSFELFFSFLGFKLNIREFYFDRRLYYNTNSGGNQETEGTDMFNYEYYLTACNPMDNKLKDIGTSEIVGSEDITPQYSLHEFNELCNEYGPAAVLGYSPIYNITDDITGEILETKVYEGKVYKYFKTNLVYYEVGLPNANPTIQQIKAITKYLDFLTPSYIARTIKIKNYSKDPGHEDIGFDGDGTKEPDAFGNFNGFDLLDGETWNNDYEEKYTVVDSNDDNKKKIVNEGHYNGLQETYKDYKNSVGGTEFRQPIDYKVINKSVNRFLTNSTGNKKLSHKRLNYFVVNKVGDKLVDSPSEFGVAIYPYYTIPPYVSSDTPYFNVVNRFYEDTKNIDLVGVPKKSKSFYSLDEDVPSVKEQIRIANLKTPIDFLTNDSIGDFVKNNERFNELGPTRIMNRTLSRSSKAAFGPGTEYGNMLDCYHREFASLNFSNLDQIKIGILEDELAKTKNSMVINQEEIDKRDEKVKEIEEEIRNIFDTQLLRYSDIINIGLRPDLYKNFTAGNFILSLNGDLKKGEFVVYRYGNYRMPNKLSNTYEDDYYSYIKSFDYIVTKDYNGSVSINKELVGLSTKFISKNNKKEIEDYIKALQEKIVQTYNDNQGKPEKWFDINYITDLLFLNKEDGEYYRAIRNPKVSQLCTSLPDHHVFDTFEEAKNFFFNIHPERRVCNAEFYINAEYDGANKISDPYLCSLMYQNRKNNSLIYSTKDGMLYATQGNSIYDIIPCKEFYGKLSIYKKDQNGKYGIVNGVIKNIEGEKFDGQKYSLGIADKEEDMYAEIDQYDKSWDGYDEIADRDDFIFYNYENHVRPIKSHTDEIYDEDLKKINKFDPSIEEGYTPDPENPDPDTGKYDKNYHYFRTIGQNLIRDISSKTIDNFTSKENLNWEYDYRLIIEEVAREINPSYFNLYVKDEAGNWKLTKDEVAQKGTEYYTKTYLGILSIIEFNLESATGATHSDREYDYYSSASDFLQAYYRIILNNNFETRHFPTSFVKDMSGISLNDYTTPLPENFTSEQIEKIKYGFKNAILQIASITERISRDRVYYSFIGRWRDIVRSSINDSKAGVWTKELKFYCSKLEKLWYNDPFAADPLNPIFFDDRYDDPSLDEVNVKSTGKKLYDYFVKEHENELGKEELFLYREYKNNYLKNNKDLMEVIINSSDKSKIVDEHGDVYYPFAAKTDFANRLLKSKETLMNKYEGHIKIEDGADPSLLGKDAYSLNEQHVYEGGFYLFKAYKNGKSYIRTLELKFGLTMDSNGDFFLPYNLSYGLQEYSLDEYGKHREIYSEFTEMLDLFVLTIHDENDKELFDYLKQYYYNCLVKDFREKAINDNYPLGLSIKGKRPARIYPKLTEKFNGKAGTFSAKSTLLSSYNNEGGNSDTNVKLKFEDLSLVVDRNKVGTMKFKVSHKNFMDTFGYDYNNYYKYISTKDLGETYKKMILEEMERMYKKQFTCIRPIFLYLEGSNDYYNDIWNKYHVRTIWQKVRNKFSIDYPSATARACDSEGLDITNEEGIPIDKHGNVLINAEDGFNRIKDGFINGYIEIKIVDDYTFSSIYNIKELNDFFNDKNSSYFGILGEKEKKYIYGYLSVKELRQTFMDNYISFPQSLKWIEKDENNIANEYYSFGDDRSVNITKRNVYFDYKKTPKENETKEEREEREIAEFLEKSRNFSSAYSLIDTTTGIKIPGKPSIHDEEVIVTSENVRPVDINGKEIYNYDITKTFEDQGIMPKYRKVDPIERLSNSKDGTGNNFIRYSEVYKEIDKEEKINIPFANCELLVNEFGEVTLKVPSSLVHTSKINKIKLLFSIPWLELGGKRGLKSIAYINHRDMNIINIISANKNPMNTIIKNKLFAHLLSLLHINTKLNVILSKISQKALLVVKIIHDIKTKYNINTGIIKLATTIFEKNSSKKYIFIINKLIAQLAVNVNTTSKNIFSQLYKIKNTVLVKLISKIKKITFFNKFNISKTALSIMSGIYSPNNVLTTLINKTLLALTIEAIKKEIFLNIIFKKSINSKNIYICYLLKENINILDILNRIDEIYPITGVLFKDNIFKFNIDYLINTLNDKKMLYLYHIIKCNNLNISQIIDKEKKMVCLFEKAYALKDYSNLNITQSATVENDKKMLYLYHIIKCNNLNISQIIDKEKKMVCLFEKTQINNLNKPNLNFNFNINCEGRGKNN